MRRGVLRRTVRYFVYAGSVCKNCFTLLRENFLILLLNSVHCQTMLDLYLSGVPYNSESSSSAPPYRSIFCADRSLSLSATFLLVLRLLMLFEAELVDGFLGERLTLAVDVDFVGPRILCCC